MGKRNLERTATMLESVQSKPVETALARGWLRIGLSALIALHLVAVVAEPFRMFTRSARGSSPVADSIRGWFAPYVEFVFLNHGYFFFAPDPGPSHVMECRLSSSGQEPRRLRLPDRKAQWPRLLYHRHFMLAEFLNTLFVPSELTEEAARIDGVRQEWVRGRRTYEMIRQSMERHLAKRYGFESAELRRIEHRWPSAYEVFAEKWPLDDERLYILLPEFPSTESLVPPSQGRPMIAVPAGNSLSPALPFTPEEIRP